jgi:hypothetical protein
MISELRLLFFASAIYFLVNHFGIFKQLDGVMKGQDEVMILSAKVGSTILILYLLIHFSKQGVVEGVENKGNSNAFYKKIEEAVREKDGTKVINLVEGNIEDMTDWMAYGAASNCNKKMNPINNDIVGAIRCMKVRLVVNTECNIKSLNQTNECIVNNIMDSIHVLKEEDRRRAWHIISEEIIKDNEIGRKMKLSNSLDNLIVSIQKDKKYHAWIEYILEIYGDLLLDQEKEYLESIK